MREITSGDLSDHHVVIWGYHIGSEIEIVGEFKFPLGGR